MDVYFRQAWHDRRLSFSVPGVEEFSMSWLFLDKIWKPDTYFLNGKRSYLHKITSPNKFVRIKQDGNLTYSMRWILDLILPFINFFHYWFNFFFWHWLNYFYCFCVHFEVCLIKSGQASVGNYQINWFARMTDNWNWLGENLLVGIVISVFQMVELTAWTTPLTI